MKESSKRFMEMINMYSEVFGSPNGKKVFADLQKSFAGPCFDPNPFVMAHNEGARSVVLKMEAMVKKSKNRLLIEQLSKEEEE